MTSRAKRAAVQRAALVGNKSFVISARKMRWTTAGVRRNLELMKRHRQQNRPSNL
jgi:hypothetical protein